MTDSGQPDIVGQIKEHVGGDVTVQPTCDGIPTVWVSGDEVGETLRWLKMDVEQPYRCLYDLTAIDERARTHRDGQPGGDFTVVYHLLSYERNADLRLKVALQGETPSIDTVTGLWPSANWYEREVWDMFGIEVAGHPKMERILLPPWWEGHPLRKEHPARATEMGHFQMDSNRQRDMMEQLAFKPEDHGKRFSLDDGEYDYMFLNMGPHHPGTHGVLRVILQLDGQEVVDAICDIGFHHRGAEKMGERQSWHTYIPYTDRVDYLGGVLNNLPYVLAVEQMAGIDVPDRAVVIRVMMCELFRIISHLVFYGTMAQDVGMMSPIFYMFADREKALDIVEGVTGGRLHPNWFRIGGVAQDLPEGWEDQVREFIPYMRRRLAQYDNIVLGNPIFRGRTRGVGQITVDQAVEWGATGPMLRSTGMDWDFRRNRPYAGYDQFEFEIPTGDQGDCYDRAAVHVEEMRQSLRIIEQCLDNMPGGPYKSKNKLATPPLKEDTMYDIETLIDHFIHVSWGPVVPAGEAMARVEGTKGNHSYYLVSDGSDMSYRTRIRTPSFPHIQMVPMMARGLMIPDVSAILGSIDFVLADVDR